MAAQPFSLETLSAQIAATANGLPALNRALSRGFWYRFAHSQEGLREQFALQNYEVALRFFVNKSESGNFFFFQKRKKRRSETAVDIDLQMAIRPVSDPPLTAKPIVFSWAPPPFLIADQPERRRLIQQTGITWPTPPVILTDGNGEIVIVGFETGGKKPKATLWYREATYSARSAKTWPAQPFLLFYNSIRRWRTGEWQDQDYAPILLDEENDLGQLLRSLLNAYRQIRQKLGNPAEGDVYSQLMNRAMPHYDLVHYGAQLTLRLNESGDFAFFDSNRSFQFGLSMDLQAGRQHFDARLRMDIPDFLIEGALYEAFWNVFLDQQEGDKQRKKLLKRIKRGNGITFSDEELSDLLQQGKADHGSVFRIDRERKMDINLFFASGRLEGTDYILIFSGKFEVRDIKRAQVELRENSLKLHYLAQNDQGTVDQDFVDYFLRIIWYFSKWVNVI